MMAIELSGRLSIRKIGLYRIRTFERNRKWVPYHKCSAKTTLKIMLDIASWVITFARSAPPTYKTDENSKRKKTEEEKLNQLIRACIPQGTQQQYVP